MKGLKKMKLTQLGKVELEEREMELLLGGCNNKCGCRDVYYYPLNSDANYKSGYHVPGGNCSPSSPDINISPVGVPCD